MEEWKASLKDWKSVSIEMANLFLSQSEKYLDETVKTFENSSRKTNQLLTISISIITFSLSYLFDFKSREIDLILIALFSLIISMFSILVLYKNLFFDQIGVKGNNPKNIIKEKFIPRGINSNEQYINLVLNVCETYQKRITRNKEVNTKRNVRIKRATYLTLLLPVSIILSKLITIFI